MLPKTCALWRIPEKCFPGCLKKKIQQCGNFLNCPMISADYTGWKSSISAIKKFGNSKNPGVVLCFQDTRKYPRIMANWTLIILFLEMLKFSKIISSKSKFFFVKNNSEYLETFYLLK